MQQRLIKFFSWAADSLLWDVGGSFLISFWISCTSGWASSNSPNLSAREEMHLSSHCKTSLEILSVVFARLYYLEAKRDPLQYQDRIKMVLRKENLNPWWKLWIGAFYLCDLLRSWFSFEVKETCCSVHSSHVPSITGTQALPCGPLPLVVLHRFLVWTVTVPAERNMPSRLGKARICVFLWFLCFFGLCWLCWLCFSTLGFAAGFVPPWTQQPAIPKPGPASSTIDALSRRNEGTRRPTKIRMSHAAHIEHRLQGKAFQSEPEYYPEYPFSYRYTSGWFETCKTFSDPLCLARILDPIGLLQSSDTEK